MLLWESRALARAGEGRSGPGQGKRPEKLIQAASWVRTLAGGIEESEEGESACKPGSVGDSHSSRTCVTTRLKRPTRGHTRAAWRGLNRSSPYLVLLRVGFTLPPALPSARCALTAPFHPYRSTEADLGGIFSVALAVGSRPPGITWHPALWSPDFPPLAPPRQPSSDCPADSRGQDSTEGMSPAVRNLKEAGGVPTSAQVNQHQPALG